MDKEGCKVIASRNPLVSIADYLFIIGLACSFFIINENFNSDFPLNRNGYAFYFICFLFIRISFEVCNKDYRYNLDIPDVLLIILTGYILLSDIQANYLNFSQKFLIISIPIFWFYIKLFVNSTQKVFFLLKWFIVFSLFQALWGMCEVYKYFHEALPQYIVKGIFINKNIYGCFLSLIFPFCIWFIYVSKQRNRKIIYLIIAIVILTCILLSQSRSAILGLCISIVYLLIYLSWKRLSLKNNVIVWGISFIVVLGLSYWLFNLNPDSAKGRLLIWKISLNTFKENILTGNGPGSFSVAYINGQEQYFRDSDFTDKDIMLADQPPFAFNEYLQIVSEWGLIGFILFSLWVFTSLYYGNPRSKYYLPLILSIITCFIFAFFSYPFRILSVLFIILMNMALLSSVNNNTKIQVARKKTSKYFILFYCLFTLYHSMDYMKFTHIYNKYIHTINQENLISQTSNLVEYEKFYPYLKKDHYFLFNYACLLKKSNYLYKAEVMLKEALKYSNDSQVLNLLGLIYKKQNKNVLAEECFWRSHYRVPNRFTPLYHLMTLYYDTSQTKKAKELAEIILNKEIKIESMEISYMKNHARIIYNNKD